MVVAIVQSLEGTWHGSGVAFTENFAGTPTSGNTMCAFFFCEDGGGTIDTTGWAQLELSAPNDKLYIFTKVAGAAEPTGVHTPATTGGVTRKMILFEVSGLIDVHGNATDASPATITGPTLTPTAASILLAAFTGKNQTYVGTATFTPSGSLVQDYAANKAPGRAHSWAGHIVTVAGAYTPTVVVTGPALNQTAGAVAVAFTAAVALIPVANFTGTPLSGTATLAVTFTDLSTNTPTSWAWTFGDGGTSTSQNPSHNYTAAGTYNVQLTATNASGSDVLLRTAYVVVTAVATPGGGFEWDGLSFTNERIKEWTIQRGASPELTGGSQPGSMTITLINTPDDRYNPENTGGDLYGMLHDGIRTWVGINADGTITADAAKTVYGLFAGRITDLSVLPGEGTSVAPFVEVVCEDELGWMSRQKVTLPDDRRRSQADLRLEVLEALDEFDPDLPVEPTTMPLSGADGLALNILDNINGANGTRHFFKPADSSADWGRYTAVRRTDGLDGTSDADLDAASDHVTGSTGWRTSADGVINQQRASVDDIVFPTPVVVWQRDSLPLTVTDDIDLWAEFGDYVDEPSLEVNSTGDALTATLTPFGDTAKVALSSAGTSVITSLVIRGRLVQRGSVQTVVLDDLVSQAEPRGVRAGPDLTGDYLGILVSAYGFAEHIVWRFGNPLYRPTLTVENWMPEMFTLDLFDRISFTSTQLGVTDRIFEIVGLTLHSDLAAGTTTPVVLHTATYVLQESRVQEPFDWFTLDVSETDETDVLAY